MSSWKRKCPYKRCRLACHKRSTWEAKYFADRKRTSRVPGIHARSGATEPLTSTVSPYRGYESTYTFSEADLTERNPRSLRHDGCFRMQNRASSGRSGRPSLRQSLAVDAHHFKSNSVPFEMDKNRSQLVPRFHLGGALRRETRGKIMQEGGNTSQGEHPDLNLEWWRNYPGLRSSPVKRPDDAPVEAGMSKGTTIALCSAHSNRHTTESGHPVKYSVINCAV